MQIYGPSYLHGAQKLSGPHASKPAKSESSGSSSSVKDSVEISDQALRLQQQSEASGDIRWEKVNAIKAQIAAGTYETPDKMSTALDRMLDDIA